GTRTRWPARVTIARASGARCSPNSRRFAKSPPGSSPGSPAATSRGAASTRPWGTCASAICSTSGCTTTGTTSGRSSPTSRPTCGPTWAMRSASRCPDGQPPATTRSRPEVSGYPFTDEHEMLRRSIRAFVEKEVAPEVGAWETAGRIPRAFWHRLGELGLLGLDLAPAYGGSGGGFLSDLGLGEGIAPWRSRGGAFSALVHTGLSS